MKYVLCVMLCLFSCIAFAVRTQPLNGTVALTFDDGPAPEYTEQILAILKKHNIKATFFMVGASAKAHPELVRRVYEEGHVIASHSYTHPLLTKLSEKKLQYEIHQPQVVIENILRVKPLCLRYPFGASNAHVRDEIRKAGIQPVPMGFNSFDYERPGIDHIVAWIGKNIHNKQVLLFHDGFNHREQTVAALPKIIEMVKQKKLGFSTICGEE